MNNILEFINNNAIVASLITLIITTFIQVIFRKSDRKYTEKIDKAKEKKKEFENKAELLIDNNTEDDGTIPRINLFMTDFTTKISGEKSVDFYYSKDVLNKKKYKHLKFYMKNIGNADINQLDICVTSQKNMMLCNVESVEMFVNNKFVNYSYCYDKKILKGKTIMIDIAYLEESRIFGLLSCELVLLFKDSYNNLYEQPFFVHQKNLYEPSKITYKDYKNHITTDLALDCFEHPWMW